MVMKKYMFLPVLLVTIALTAGCKKDGDGTSTILREDFISVHLLPGNDWKFVNNNAGPITAQWTQGSAGYKGYTGFPAHSYANSPDEYAFVKGNYGSVGVPVQISAWMITRNVLLRNGYIIRFFTRSTSPGTTDRLQVLLSETTDSYDAGNTATSVGVFTKLLLDINPTQIANGYPADWTLQTVAVSGLNGSVKTRLAFRYIANGVQSQGVGVDEFSISRN